MEQTHKDQENTGKKCGKHKTIHTVPGNNSSNDSSKGSGRSCDLYPAAAKKGNQKSGNNCGIQTFLRTNTGSQCQGDGKGQGNDRYNDTCDYILQKLFLCVALQTGK